MREIKFRGYSKEKEQWYYGFLSKDYFEEEEDYYYIDYEFGSPRVVEESIGQFTGFTDKNGVEIYEGDIVRYCALLCEVVFSEKKGQWLMKYIDAEYERLCQNLTMTEVIGNIYEEKLKEDK